MRDTVDGINERAWDREMAGPARKLRRTSLFAVFIGGSNGAAAHAWAKRGRETLGVRAAPAGGEASPVSYGEGDWYGHPALFGSREAARACGLACHWNGQTFEVRPARGWVRREGILLEGPPAEWMSCQEVRS